MRSSRSHWSIPWQFVAVATAIVVAAMPNLSYAQKAQVYTGEQLFKGLYLGQGPVADLFPEVWEGAEEYREHAIPAEDMQEVMLALSDYADTMIEDIAAANPGFFSSFAVEIQSGDHLRIEAAVLDGAYKLVEAIAADLGVAPEDLKPFDPTQNLVIIVVVLAAALAAVSLAVLATQLASALWAAWVVAVFQIYAAVYVDVAIQLHFDPAESTLPLEIWIDWVATRLAI